MELEKFVKTTIKAIGKGIREGTEEGNFEAGYPSSSQTPGVEFDLAINITGEEVYVVTYQTKDTPPMSRIRFSIPLYSRR